MLNWWYTSDCYIFHSLIVSQNPVTVTKTVMASLFGYASLVMMHAQTFVIQLYQDQNIFQQVSISWLITITTDSLIDGDV